jgi:hypothetical protein
MKKELIIEGISNAEIFISDDIFDKFHQNNNSNFIEKDNENRLLLKKTFFSIEHQVPNVLRYSLYKTESNSYQLKSDLKKDIISNFNDKKLDEFLLIQNNKPIILKILESPHEDEYDYQNEFKPIAPAQGATGKQISQNFDKIINKNINSLNLIETEYRIVILKPIPYQTSLHYLHRQPINMDGYQLLRDLVWETLWNENNTNFKKEFSINILKLKPSLIINACTKELSKLVEVELFKSQYNEFCKSNSCHPYSWVSVHNRKLTFY